MHACRSTLEDPTTTATPAASPTTQAPTTTAADDPGPEALARSTRPVDDGGAHPALIVAVAAVTAALAGWLVVELRRRRT